MVKLPLLGPPRSYVFVENVKGVAIETPTPISAMVYKDGISNVMDKAFALPAMQRGGQRTPFTFSTKTYAN